MSNRLNAMLHVKARRHLLVFRCGNLILSACRTQASIALSSCEAELLAGTAAAGDAIQMSHILEMSGE